MKIRLRTLAVLGLAGLSGSLLLGISQRVQQADKDLRTLEAKVERERETIDMLTAEWAHLNNPERLEDLAQRYLDLGLPAPESLAVDGHALPGGMAQEAAQVHSAVFVTPTRKPERSGGAP